MKDESWLVVAARTLAPSLSPPSAPGLREELFLAPLRTPEMPSDVLNGGERTRISGSS